MTDHFNNDPRGVSEHTQAQIDAHEYLKQDLASMMSAFSVMIDSLAAKHDIIINADYVETAMQWIEDAFHKPLTDLENRIGKE